MTQRKQRGSVLPRRIVVAVDDSGTSDHAVRAGVELGRLLKASVDVVHAVAIPAALRLGMDVVSRGAFTSAVLEGARKRVETRFRSICAGRSAALPARRQAARTYAAPANRKLRARVRIAQGRPAKILLDCVREKSHAWLVLGAARPRKGYEFGSTLSGVSARSGVPVWVQSGRPRQIRRILVPVDLSADSQGSLDLACMLATVLHARVTALHCFHLGFDLPAGSKGFGAGMQARIDEMRRAERVAFDREMQGFDWRGVEHSSLFVEGPPAETILERGRRFDLIVLGTHGKTALSTFVLGGTAHAVLGRSSTAVLAVPARRRGFRVRVPARWAPSRRRPQ